MSIYEKYLGWPGIRVLDNKKHGIENALEYSLRNDLEILAVSNYMLKTGDVDIVGIQEGDTYKIYAFSDVKKHKFPILCDVIVMKFRDVMKNVDLDRANDSFESLVEHCQRNNDHVIFG